jgi:hypothetical protein
MDSESPRDAGMESLFDDVYRTLSRLADGRIDAAQARIELRGKDAPNHPAWLIKKGLWANSGDYATGTPGARQAAHDALCEMGRAE